MSKALTTQKNKMGRPTIMTQAVLNKLEAAWSVGATDKMACFYAGISHQALYNYQNDHPEFVERKEGLKEKMVLKALNVVASALNDNDTNTAKWYLEKKRKAEFGNAIDVTSGGEALRPDIQVGQMNVQVIAAEVAAKLKEEKLKKPNDSTD